MSCRRQTEGEVALDVYKDEAAVLKDKGHWQDAVQNIRAGTMPPKGRPKPDAAEIERVTNWIDALLSKGAGALAEAPIRRLNRTEYNNTIRDLIGLDFRPADDFPGDSAVFGFDNIGLSIGSELVIQRYLKAAAEIVERAFRDPQLKKRIMICQPADKDAAQRIIEDFARRAYRRPVTKQEVDRIVKGLVEPALKKEESFDNAIQVALKAILVSPHFLFRVELEREAGELGGLHALSDFELATRLSYFLWSSMPDEELFQQAKQGTLRKNLEAQVRRMLKDPKAAGLVDNFFGQWLELRMVQTVAPDPKKFPSFNDDLRSAMVKETELFCEAIVKEDRSILDFLDADFTFVNEPLARHYGIEGIKGEQLQRVTMTGKARQQRGGILTQASILTATSKPTGTSPPKEGNGSWTISWPRRRSRLRPMSMTCPRKNACRSRCGNALSCIEPIRRAPLVMTDWIRWASPWSHSTPSAAGGRWMESFRSTPPRSCRAGKPSMAPTDSKRSSRPKPGILVAP